MTATLFFALAQFCYYSALVMKPNPYRRLFMVPIALGTIYFFRHAVQYHSPLEYIYGCAAVGQFFFASSYILVTDPQRELHMKGEKRPAWTLPLFERFIWATKLNSSVRAIGWSHEPTYALPPPPSTAITRSKFVAREVGYLALDVLLYDILSTYAKRSPSFAANGYSIAGDGLFWRVVNVLVIGLLGVTGICFTYGMFSVLAVSSGISKPCEWFPIFGRCLDVYSLRSFWGRSWHQLARWPGVAHGRFIAHGLLRLPKGAKLAYLIQVYTAFAITALIHVGGEYTLIGYWSNRHALRFFLLQAVAITVEDLVIEAGSKVAIRGPWRMLGYLWVLAWFTFTVPCFIDPLLRGGLVDSAPTIGLVSRLIDL